MKVQELPLSERPREKLLERGARHLTDRELLALILGRGTRKCDVMSLSGKLVSVLDRSGLDFQAQDILDIEGIGEAKATAIAAAFEFVRRRIRPEGIKVRKAADVLPLIQHYGDRKQEYFLCISLNGAHEVMNVRVITIGLVNQTQVHPREVFADVIAERATAIIIAHNHPSGELAPSPQDRAVTRQIKDAGQILGISLLDHLIFSQKGFYSFAEEEGI